MDDKAIFQIEADRPLTYQYGQTVYSISCRCAEDIHDKCPVCDDTKKVVIRGFELDCPNCASRSPYRSQALGSDYLAVHDYSLTTAIIHDIRFVGPETNCSYKAGNDSRPRVYFVAFSHTTSGYSSVSHFNVPTDKWRIDPPLETILASRSVSDYVYTDKKLALKAIDALRDQERQKIAEFNKTHKTSHVYKPDTEHTK